MSAPTVVVVHAHPDDETLSSGALLASWARSGTRVVVVTCTRGERGEVVPGTADGGDLEVQREGELRAALACLAGDGSPGAIEHVFLGTAPARALGLPERRYRDSGMRWIREGLAGPAEDVTPDAFTAAPITEEAADLAALLHAVSPQAVLGYDDGGTYGHPDHVRAHEVTREAARIARIPRAEIVSEGADETGAQVIDLPEYRGTVTDALRCYRTQLSVVHGGIVHVGGQHQDISTRIAIREIGSH